LLCYVETDAVLTSIVRILFGIPFKATVHV
jgi:hypothetical protein